jgi:hypothetical protein
VLDDRDDRRRRSGAADGRPRLAVADLAVVQLDLDQRAVERRDAPEVGDVLGRLGDRAAEPGCADIADRYDGLLENGRRSLTSALWPEDNDAARDGNAGSRVPFGSDVSF